jgi:NhaA family Na+:H+ antiporter
MTDHDEAEGTGASEGPFVLTLLQEEAASGVLLTVTLLVAVAWASLAAGSYASFVSASVSIPSVPSPIVHDLTTLVENLLMIVFFLAIGLEIGRERAVGALADKADAPLPIAAAAGGMLGAALTYLLVVALAGGQGLAGGWGIPMATDVAFTLAALSLLGSRVPTELRVFLLALAIADDVGSVVVLALTAHQGVGTSALERLACAAAVAVVLVGALVARRRRRAPWTFVLLAVALWWLLAQLGIEPTLAGVAIGVIVPTGDASSSGLRLESAVAPVSAFVILPLFALVAAGVDLTAKPWQANGALIAPLLAARSVGKALGILGACLLAIRLGVGRLPRGVGWRQLAGAALLCGIGFTVPLLFAEHSFAGEPVRLAATKVALLGASLVCAIAGLAVLARTLPRSRR